MIKTGGGLHRAAGPFLAALATAVLCLARPASGAETEAESGAAETSPGDRLEEVVVTAQRREERLQDVPVSVTALTPDKLERQQIQDVLALNAVVPGVVVKSNFNAAEINIGIRGIANYQPLVTVDPPVGVYVDGVYTAISAGTNSAMVDMARVEVLKGPQGTLFGRNTIGGALNIETAKPTSGWGGWMQATGGNYGQRGVTAVANIPIASEGLSARVVYDYLQHDGYGTNRNFVAENPTNSLDRQYVRASLRWATPDDKFEAVVTGHYDHEEGYSPAWNLARIESTNPFNALLPALSGHPGDLLSNYTGGARPQNSADGIPYHFRLQNYGVNGTLRGELNDFVTVKSITGYTRTDLNENLDLDTTPYAVFDLLQFPLSVKQVSEELQAYGSVAPLGLRWITGLYYYQEDGSQIGTFDILPAFSPVPLLTINGATANNKSYSGFAQVDYSLTSSLILTAGARYVTDKRAVTYPNYSVARATGAFLSCGSAATFSAASPATCGFSDSAVFHYIPWTFSIGEHVSDSAFVYAKISKGFRSGAFAIDGPPAVADPTLTPAQLAVANAGVVASFQPAKPESILTPEVGAKFELLDRHLIVDLAAYYSNYTNVQLIINTANAGCASCPPISLLRNSGTIHIPGGEAEISALLGKLRVDTQIGITRPKYVAGPDVGQPVPIASSFNGSFTPTYTLLDTGLGVLSLSSTFSYRSAIYTAPPAIGQSAYVQGGVRQGGYGLLDARLTFNFNKQPLTVTLYGRNLTDRVYYPSSTGYSPPLDFTVRMVGDPRTYGATVRYDFK